MVQSLRIGTVGGHVVGVEGGLDLFGEAAERGGVGVVPQERGRAAVMDAVR